MNAYQRRGASPIAVVVGIVAVIVVGLAAWYFISDPFKARTDETIDQLTKWTPENIAKDPVGYLNFVEKKTQQAQQQLKADRISVAQNKAKLEAMKDEAANKVRIGEQTLKDLKTAYEKAKGESATDPAKVEWKGQEKDASWIKSQLVTIFKQTETQKSILAKVDGGLTKLAAQLTKIEKAEGDAVAQLAEIAANKELLKVQKLTDDLKTKLVSIRGAVEGVVNTAGSGSDALSLDQLAAETTTTPDSSEFDKVMNKIK